MQKYSKTYSSRSKNYRNKGGRRLHSSIVAKNCAGLRETANKIMFQSSHDLSFSRKIFVSLGSQKKL